MFLLIAVFGEDKHNWAIPSALFCALLSNLFQIVRNYLNKKSNSKLITTAGEASKEMIWREGGTVYAFEDVTDPDYCVLEFVAESGRYYANFHSESFEII